MGQQVNWHRLTAAFPPQVRVWGKTGSLLAVRDELGVAGGARYAVAVFTKARRWNRACRTSTTPSARPRRPRSRRSFTTARTPRSTASAPVLNRRERGHPVARQHVRDDLRQPRGLRMRVHRGPRDRHPPRQRPRRQRPPHHERLLARHQTLVERHALPGQHEPQHELRVPRVPHVRRAEPLLPARAQRGVVQAGRGGPREQHQPVPGQVAQGRLGPRRQRRVPRQDDPERRLHRRTQLQPRDVHRCCSRPASSSRSASSRTCSVVVSSCRSSRTSGLARPNSASTRPASSGGTPTRSASISPRCAFPTSVRIRSHRASRSRDSASRIWPASVSSTRRLSRSNSRAPRSVSSLRMRWPSGGWAMPSRSAARPKWSSSATTTK